MSNRLIPAITLTLGFLSQSASAQYGYGAPPSPQAHGPVTLWDITRYDMPPISYNNFYLGYVRKSYEIPDIDTSNGVEGRIMFNGGYSNGFFELGGEVNSANSDSLFTDEPDNDLTSYRFTIGGGFFFPLSPNVHFLVRGGYHHSNVSNDFDDNKAVTDLLETKGFYVGPGFRFQADRLEVNIYGTFYHNFDVDNTFGFDAELLYHVNNTFGVGANVGIEDDITSFGLGLRFDWGGY